MFSTIDIVLLVTDFMILTVMIARFHEPIPLWYNAVFAGFVIFTTNLIALIVTGHLGAGGTTAFGVVVGFVIAFRSFRQYREQKLRSHQEIIRKIMES